MKYSKAFIAKAIGNALHFLLKDLKIKPTDLKKILGVPVSIGTIKNKQLCILQVDKALPQIVDVLKVHYALCSLFKEQSNRMRWMKMVHPQMKMSPIQKMKQSKEDLKYVRGYVEYHAHNGW